MGGDRIEVYSLRDIDRLLKDLYGDAGEQARARFQALIDGFKQKYGHAPDFVGRAPGRVNLIGEHIDYMGYAVLPMAIRQDTIVAIGNGHVEEEIDGKVHVANLHVENLHERFLPQEFDINPDTLKARTDNTWVNYVMAPYKGTLQYVAQRGLQSTPFARLDVMIEGQVPQGSGLSSSAAIVCSTSLALLGLLGVDAPPGEVAQFTAECEKFVGTESGGMDQAISIMGELGKAKLVHFNPIRTENVELPKGAQFVIANSLTVSAKAEDAPKRYNMRVVECRLATALLGLKLGRSQETYLSWRTLRDVENALAGPKGGAAAVMEGLVKEHLDQDVYMPEELETLLGVNKLEDMFNESQSKSIEFAREEGKGFNLRDRALHVYSEAARVLDFKAVCDSDASEDDKLRKLASLMDASHASCDNLYNCSCKELNKLVDVSKEAGALASRLTGAGWGGCTVSLVRNEDVEPFIAKVKQNYYLAGVNNHLPLANDFEGDGEGGWQPSIGWANVIFASPPGSGGAILDLRQ